MRDFSDLHTPSSFLFFLLSIVENLGTRVLPKLQSSPLLLDVTF